MPNSNTTQPELTNAMLQNTDVSTLVGEEPESDNIIMQLEKEFSETIESELQQHAQELLSFIDSEIEQISGTGL